MKILHYYIIAFACGIMVWVLLDRFGFSISTVDFFILPFLFFLIAWLIVVEIWSKIKILDKALPPMRFISTDVNSYPDLDRDELERYTKELEKLGFVRLTEYTLESQAQTMARVFAHSEYLCFADIGYVPSFPMLCSISSVLERDYLIAVINSPHNQNLDRINAAFLTHRHFLGERIAMASPEQLLKIFLPWRREVESKLGVATIPDMTIETYFEAE